MPLYKSAFLWTQAYPGVPVTPHSPALQILDMCCIEMRQHSEEETYLPGHPQSQGPPLTKNWTTSSGRCLADLNTANRVTTRIWYSTWPDIILPRTSWCCGTVRSRPVCAF